jgi:ubiquinone/menaquinone biosynthesis C-methylase UbiE
MGELRPDLKLFASDLAGQPEKYPKRCAFQRADFERDSLQWPDQSMDTITCMQLLEHLHDPTHLIREVARLLRPGGRAFFETPHPKSLNLPSPPCQVKFTLNFYDDPTHTKVVKMEDLASLVQQSGLQVQSTGISRNWLFAMSHPFFVFMPPSRKKFTAYVHWLGWSAFLIAKRRQ